MPERDFLIERYCSANWVHVLGQRPFIAAGPSFMTWIVPDSLDKLGRHIMRPSIRNLLRDIFPVSTAAAREYQQHVIAEVLLREGVLVALWSRMGEQNVSRSIKWQESIDQLVREIPMGMPVHEAIEELLSGMQSPSMVREYLSEDGIALDSAHIPELNWSLL